MPLDIMSGFSGGAAPTGAAQTGAPPVSGSDPTVTFASLLTGKATASPKGSVKTSGGGDGDPKKDDSKSDAKTGGASAKLDPSLIAWNIVPPTSPPQILLPQIQSEPTVPPNADAKAGTSVAMDASQVLSRLQASGSQTGGELLSTLKQTIAAAAGGNAAVAALPASAGGAMSAVASSVAAVAAGSPSGSADSPISALVSGKSATDNGLPVAAEAVMASSKGASTDIVAPPAPSLDGASGPTRLGASGLAATASLLAPTALEAHMAPTVGLVPTGDGSGVKAPSVPLAANFPVSSVAPAAATAASANSLVAAGVGANSVASPSAAPVEKSTLQKVRGRSDNNGVNDVRTTVKGGGKELPASLLQSLNAKAGDSSNAGGSSLSEALVKAEITREKAHAGESAPAALTTSETGKATVVDQPIAVPMPARDRAAMIHQVVEKIGEMKLDAKGAGGDKVTMQLHPQDWGQLNLTVTMTPKIDANGQTTTMVTAHVAAENPAVKAALEGHLNDLRRSLHEQGLKLDSLTVTMGSVSAASAASQSNGGGLMSGHPHSNDGGQAPAGQTSAQSGGFNESGQGQRPFADFAAGQFGGGQREQQAQPAWTAHDADQDSSPVAAIRSAAAGRVDTRA